MALTWVGSFLHLSEFSDDPLADDIQHQGNEKE
jgi:hypothetical protein